MAIVKYRTYYGTWRDAIEVVECTRETDQSVWVMHTTRGIKPKTAERRHAKRSEYEQYHDTWDEAKAYLVTKAESEVESVKAQLASAEKNLTKMQALAQKAGQ